MKKHMRFRFLLIPLTVLVVLAFLVCGYAEDLQQPHDEAESAAELSGSVQVSGSEGLSNTEAMEAYINNAMSFKKSAASRVYASTALRSRLTNAETKLYDELLAKIVKVAEGKLASTVFVVSYPNISNNAIRKVHEALLGDCASELYWYDKECGIRWETVGGKLKILFFVAAEYSVYRARWSTTVDTSIGRAVQAARENARAIITANRGKSDTEKMRAYKNKICELNEYNYAAVNNNFTPYGNPWQLIWVFDGDPDTKVVCEGYAKAFQYLCEMSSFSGNVTVMSMTGEVVFLNGSGGGRHMWNVVTMSDKNRYLVDVTFCDDGATGSDRYFLAGYDDVAMTAYGKGYVYNGYAYVFDRDVYGLYKKADTSFAPINFDPATDPTLANGGCGADTEWAVTNGGVLKIGGSGPMDDYEAGQTPWSAYSGSIKKITISDGVTRIGNNAFAGLKKVKTVTGGKGLNAIGDGAYQGCTALKAITLESKVKTIGSDAFRNCKKLKTITILTTKLKKSNIGAGAFKKISGKATFVCPGKKLEAYQKMLLKKGAPKTATFK